MARTKGALGKKTLIARGLMDARESMTEVSARSDNGMFTFRADSCGCEIKKPMIGCGLFCEHKNNMILVNRKSSK